MVKYTNHLCVCIIMRNILTEMLAEIIELSFPQIYSQNINGNSIDWDYRRKFLLFY